MVMTVTRYPSVTKAVISLFETNKYLARILNTLAQNVNLFRRTKDEAGQQCRTITQETRPLRRVNRLGHKMVL
jgi:hypothetical protein